MSIASLRMPAALALAGLLLTAPAGHAGQASDPARAGGEPLRLRDAIAEALRHSPTLRPAADRVAFADLDRRVAASRFALRISPSLGAGLASLGDAQTSAGVAVTKRLRTGTDVRFSADAQQYGASGMEMRDVGYSFAIAQPLVHAFGPTATADLTNAERAVTSSARGLEDARRRVVLEVAAAFYAIVRQQRLVEAGTRALDRAATLRRASEARTKVGLATQLDVLRAELLAAQAEAHLATQREALEAGVDRLKMLVGRPVEAPLEIAPDARPDDSVSPIVVRREDDVESLVARARASRLELQEARDRIADAERRASVARWNLLPNVTLNASYTRRGVGSPGGSLLNDLLGGWRIGLTTSYDLDRTVEAAASETAGIAVGAARRALADLEQQVAADVRRAWRARARAAASVAIQAKAVELARKQLRLAELRYERGLAGNFDVVDAETNVFQAESALIAAEVERALADLGLDHAVGTLNPERYQP